MVNGANSARDLPIDRISVLHRAAPAPRPAMRPAFAPGGGVSMQRHPIPSGRGVVNNYNVNTGSL